MTYLDNAPRVSAVAARVTERLKANEMSAREYATAINALPEAATRPRAAQQIIQSHNSISLPVHRAQAMLANMRAEPKDKPVANHNADLEALLERCAQIRMNALSLNADRGDAAARAEVKAISYAFRVKQTSPNASMVDCLRTAGANMAVLTDMMKRAQHTNNAIAEANANPAPEPYDDEPQAVDKETRLAQIRKNVDAKFVSNLERSTRMASTNGY